MHLYGREENRWRGVSKVRFPSLLLNISGSKGISQLQKMVHP